MTPKKIEEYYFEVYDFVLSRVHYNKEDAEDISQHTIEKALSKVKVVYKEQNKLKYWLFTIARNVIVDRIRKSARRPEIDRNAKVNRIVGDDPDDWEIFSIDDSERKNIVFDLILELPQDQQEVIKLYYFESLSFKEIATYKDEPLNTVLAKMYRAKKNIKKLLAEKHPYL